MQEKYYIWQNHIMHIELINLISPVGKKFRRNTPRPCSSNASTQFQRHLEVTKRRMLRNRKKKCLTPASAMLQRMQRCRKITEILDLPLDIRLVIACIHSQTEHSNRNHQAAVVKLGVRMYFRKASDFQRPIARVCASENPDSAAKVAAPIRKLWPLYLVGSSPQWLRTVDKISLKTFRCTGRPSTVQNKVPSERPR